MDTGAHEEIFTLAHKMAKDVTPIPSTGDVLEIARWLQERTANVTLDGRRMADAVARDTSRPGDAQP